MRFATATAVCSVLLLGWSSHAFSPSTDASRMPATACTTSSSYSSSAEAASSSALFASSSSGRRASSASNAIAKARARREAKARQAAAAPNTTKKRPADQILDEAMQQSRDTILGRDGEHFAFDRIVGKVEFGSTAELVTPLDTEDLEPSAESVGLWLSDARRVAGGLWDEDLLTDLGQCTYRLGLMPLKFVTIELAPTVDVKMWTDGTTNADADSMPTFRLHSIGFEPNVTLLPGVGLDAKSLGIEIEVCGELRPTADGKGCEGNIGFVSRGSLPPPMRVLPDSVIAAAGATISKTVRDFAVANFQSGAVKQYRAFCLEEQDSLAAAESTM